MNQPTIAVITYNTPHRKTQDVLHGLKAKGYQYVKIYALPFVRRENPFKPIFQHRPSKAINIEIEDYARNFNYQFATTTAETLNQQLIEDKADFVIIAGAGLLPDDLVVNHKIINTHPGFLPKTRGLDSLKWAIVKGVEIGVTTHFVDTEADAGFLIEQKLVPIYHNDTFHSVATRQYEMEIEMLINSIELIPNLLEFPSLSTTEYEATRRMPKTIEQDLMDSFEIYKNKFQLTE
ncbi:formyltransferase family protein [Faecalibacter rhinopitheci]|uniref:phosphoribosylglycinamide formyltransferase 1 n=1 Tax=Faecalibacter rhinopitheci TaxID=2779678 RepID=A0A8J7K357_9FLAO|nr:formyltransferase family protein [Faecalibacter rhinopitheci]MBF0596168.1 formyl transferase [Faecalibacter rhinopitheci]MBQ0148874.1 formyl transferase [Candidatus Onthonaster equi]